MSQSKDVCKNATMEDKVGVPTIHRKTSAIMADYLKGGITFAEAGTELDGLFGYVDSLQKLPMYSRSRNVGIGTRQRCLSNYGIDVWLGLRYIGGAYAPPMYLRISPKTKPI